jgi:5-methylcytosine-specific restriction enzyme A
MPTGTIYNRKAWIRFRQVMLAREPLCRRCGAPAVAVDHIQPISAGGDHWDPDNLQSLCIRCHNAKTRNMDQLGKAEAPIKGCDANGMPLDPHHWWRK